ncbi:MAG: YncE family protein, partial [Candidatus Marsarchaeota archaeon]
ANGYVYVVDQRSNSVSVIGGMRLIANITVGSLPDSVTYDPQNHCIYVANAGSNSVSVIYNLTCLGSFPVGPGPSALAYDSDNQMLYVSDSGNDALTAVKVMAPPYVFPVEFSVIGISKLEWRLCENGTYVSSRNGTLTLYLPRGDYQYEVYPPFGYVGKALSGGFQVNSSRVITVVLSRSTLPPIRLILLMIAMISVLAFIVSIIRRGYRGSSKTDDIGFIGGFAFCRFPSGALPFRAVGCIPPRILPWFVPVPDIRGLTTVARWQAPALIEALGEILKPATDDIL